MIELLKKEWRALRPLALLVIGVYGALFLYSMASEFPDLPDDPSRESETSGLLVLLGLFAAMTGASLLTSESTDGTLRFLDSLPVSRTRIFWAKVLAGIGLLQFSILLAYGLDLFSVVVEHQSTTAPIHWAAGTLWYLQESIAGIYLLSVCVMLSFTRRWFTLAVGFVFWIYLALRVNNVAWTSLLDPHELMTYASDETHLRFPWRHAAAALSVSAVSLAVSWLGFQSLGDRIEHAADRAGRWRFATVVRFFGILLIPVVWLGAIYYVGKIADPTMGKGAATGGEKSFGNTETERYDFVFRESQKKTAEPLIEKADSIHDQVTGFLSAQPVPGQIVVDLGSSVIEHAAGQTNWTKIRVPLSLGLPEAELETVLGHETTHVYIDQLSNGAMSRHFDNARFFHEGLATYVEHKFFSTPEDRLKMHRLAAAAASRGKVPFETLVSNETLGKERDTNLVYPLGEVFCEALVAAHGDEAPGKLLRAFARPGAPAGISGEALWRDAMQSCGYSLDRVIAEYDAGLDRAMTEEAGFIAKFPMLTSKVEVVGDEIVIHAQFEGTAPGRILCMLEPVFGVTILPVGPDRTVSLPRSQHPGPKLRYTLGWASDDLRWPLFEKWTDANL